MKLYTWFYFSRNERLAVIILLLLLVLILLVRGFREEQNTEYKECDFARYEKEIGLFEEGVNSIVVKEKPVKAKKVKEKNVITPLVQQVGPSGEFSEQEINHSDEGLRPVPSEE